MYKKSKIAFVATFMAISFPAFATQIILTPEFNYDGTVTFENGLSRSNFSLSGTAWDPGTDSTREIGDPAPGGATFSIMGSGFLDATPFDPGHVGTTQLMTALGIPGFLISDYAAVINAALNIWDAVSGFTNLGEVPDGAVDAGAPNAFGGDVGDIRVGAWEIGTPGVLAHAFLPCNEALCGPGGSIGGDTHFDLQPAFPGLSWVNDPAAAIPGIDFFTVALHELGHSLGLGHSDVLGSVMEPVYAGPRRTLQADDIAGIQTLYGVQVPEPGTLSLFCLGLLAIGWLQRQKIRS